MGENLSLWKTNAPKICSWDLLHSKGPCTTVSTEQYHWLLHYQNYNLILQLNIPTQLRLFITPSRNQSSHRLIDALPRILHSLKSFTLLTLIWVLKLRMKAEEEGHAIGIDLGTTYSCVAVWQHDQLEVIVNDQGNRTTPSQVAFTDTETFVGDAALNQIIRNPTNSIFGKLLFLR